jgi:hypothetical protein
MRRAFLALILSGAVAATLCVRSGQTAVPLAVTISRLQMVAPGRVGFDVTRFDVTIAGLRPELTPTIEGAATVGGAIHGPRAPAPGARILAAIDLPAGRIRVGGDASVVEFPPVPPIEENTPIGLDLTVRQGAEVATARQAGMLLLPTVIVPGYLNDFGGSPRQGSSLLSSSEAIMPRQRRQTSSGSRTALGLST